MARVAGKVVLVTAAVSGTRSAAVHCQINKHSIRCNFIHASSIDTPMAAQGNLLSGLQSPGEDDPVGLASLTMPQPWCCIWPVMNLALLLEHR